MVGCRNPGQPMSVIPIRSEASTRGARMLRTALGAEIARWLEEPAVIEVMLNNYQAPLLSLMSER